MGHSAIGWRSVSWVGVIDDLSIHRIGPRPTMSRNTSIEPCSDAHRPADAALAPVRAERCPRSVGVGASRRRPRRRRAPHESALQRPRQPVVAGGEHRQERGEHQAQRGGHPVVAAEAVLEGVLVDQQQDGHRRVGRPAAGEQERLGEQLGGRDELQDQRHEQDVAELRQRDVADLLPDRRAVHLGGVVQLGRDPDERREIDDHRRAGARPRSPR